MFPGRLLRFAAPFLSVLAATAATDPKPSTPFVLSTEGSGRATGYGEASKIITAASKTHVAWLDADTAGFHVRVRTLDRTTGQWSPAYDIGDAQDNHGGPGLTIDRQGYLHILDLPHHRPFHYRSLPPPAHDASARALKSFSAKASPIPSSSSPPTIRSSSPPAATTRPTTTSTRSSSGANPPPATGNVRASSSAPATSTTPIFRSSLAWGPDHRTIHLSCRIYETNPEKGAKPIETLGYLRSPDAGASWQRLDGTAVTLPATADTIEVLARGGADTGRTLYAGSLAVDARGVPHLLHSIREDGAGRTFLADPNLRPHCLDAPQPP